MTTLGRIKEAIHGGLGRIKDFFGGKLGPMLKNGWNALMGKFGKKLPSELQEPLNGMADKLISKIAPEDKTVSTLPPIKPPHPAPKIRPAVPTTKHADKVPEFPPTKPPHPAPRVRPAVPTSKHANVVPEF